MTVQSDDVRRLLDADGDAVLVLLAGRTEVISGAELDDEEHRGALQVITRADLLDRVGDAEPSESDLTVQAALLDAEVAQLGG